jgi:adenylate kinase
MMAATNRLMRPIYRMGYSSLASQKASNPWGVAGMDRESWNRPRKEDPKGRNMQWVFLGSPGVGKGTYASRLSRLLGIPHIATGDLLREELAQSGPSANEVTDSGFFNFFLLNQGVFVLDYYPVESSVFVQKFGKEFYSAKFPLNSY